MSGNLSPAANIPNITIAAINAIQITQQIHFPRFFFDRLSIVT